MPTNAKSVAAKTKRAPLKDGVAKKRRSPITRAEGEKRLINAAIDLMTHNPFADIGVREIAKAADVNHGFVHTWFGSKNDLLLSVLRELCVRMAENATKSNRTVKIVDPSDPEIRLIGLLLIRLDMEGLDAWSLLLDQPYVQAQAADYREMWGLTEKDTRTALLQGIFIWTSLATFGGASRAHHPDSAVDVDDVVDLWRHILGLLGQHPRP